HLASPVFRPAPLLFVSHCHADHRALPPFPTRRSSDLPNCLRRSSRLAAAAGNLAVSLISRSCRALKSSAFFHRSPLSLAGAPSRSEEHTSELQSREKLVCRLLLEKKKTRLAHWPRGRA